MYLSKLQLYNFRNYEDSLFTFSEGLNCIVGKNGSGKTNLLDAIYFLALCKSSIHLQDNLSIRFEEDFSIIEGAFNRQKRTENISVSLIKQGKKTVLANGKAYERLAEHIGKYPVVLIAPNDTDLIRDGAENRRKLFDGLLSQTSEEYLEDYLQYNRALDNRNSLLKQFAEQNYFDADLLKIYSEKIISLGTNIHQARKTFIQSFTPKFNSYYSFLSGEMEKVELTYVSDFEEPDFEKRFYKNLEKDLAAQRTTLGVHKDDYLFLMNEQPIKKFGSQGQKKSFVMAIKLAQFEWIKSLKGFNPILLLDDIFDKLDEFRIQQLLEIIENFGQVFITDARPERTRQLLKNSKVNTVEIGEKDSGK